MYSVNFMPFYVSAAAVCVKGAWYETHRRKCKDNLGAGSVFDLLWAEFFFSHVAVCANSVAAAKIKDLFHLTW
jgi:hypothetical protein